MTTLTECYLYAPDVLAYTVIESTVYPIDLDIFSTASINSWTFSSTGQSVIRVFEAERSPTRSIKISISTSYKFLTIFSRYRFEMVSRLGSNQLVQYVGLYMYQQFAWQSLRLFPKQFT